MAAAAETHTSVILSYHGGTKAPSNTPVSTKSKGKVGSLLKRWEIKRRLEGGTNSKSSLQIQFADWMVFSFK